MGYADGYYYGQGRIICDTSTFSVGDTIRVRSMTDSSKVWNQQVATVGTALVFTVPPYDYYKICTVQDIGGVATEVGGVYKTVDYGQTYLIDVIDKSSLGGIQGILNAGQQSTLLSVGDEVTLLVDGANEQWQIAHINPSNASYPSNSVILCRKEVYGSIKINTKNYGIGNLKSYMSDFYNTISARDKAYIKQKTVNAAYSTSALSTSTDNYVWCPTSWEMNYTTNSNESSTNVPFSLFATQVGRTKGNAYWTASGHQNGTGMVYVNASGVTGNSGDLSPTYATLPCIMLTADS